MPGHVRERPSLAESLLVTTPGGKPYRWAQDERASENVPFSGRYSDIMPGGYETHDCTLPRKPEIDYSDFERLSKLQRFDASGKIIWEGRLERAPRVSGDQIAISPSAVGYQAMLGDDKSVREIYRDIDFTHWGPISATRRLSAIADFGVNDPTTNHDPSTGAPVLSLRVSQPWDTAPGRPLAEALYDAHGLPIGSVYYAWRKNANVLNADTNWTWRAGLSPDDSLTSIDTTGNLLAAGPGSGTIFSVTFTSVVAFLQFFYANVAVDSTPNTEYAIDWTTLAVYGDHGLTLRGTEPDAGFYDADIIRHAIARWCPLLSVTDESVTAGSFLIPHAVFLEPTTVGEIVRQATRFGLRDWAVWEGPTFWLHDRGARGTAWRARVRPARLEETGPQVDRLWESVIVQYQDVDGSTRTVGPPGSGADTETSDLKDDDPDNPANKLGITRRDLLVMGTGTATSATEVGARFLEQSRLLDTSGRAVITGYVEDDRGILHPYSHIQSGDTMTFVDASDPSPRRIVHTDKNRSDRTCTIDLDAPPEGLQALLERLGVVLVPLGL